MQHSQKTAEIDSPDHFPKKELKRQAYCKQRIFFPNLIYYILVLLFLLIIKPKIVNKI
jgi:hypothetical protein